MPINKFDVIRTGKSCRFCFSSSYELHLGNRLQNVRSQLIIEGSLF